MKATLRSRRISTALTPDLASAFRSAIERAGLRSRSTATPLPAAASTSIATCGRRSSSTCSRTRSSSRSTGGSRVDAEGHGRRASRSRSRDTGVGIAPRRAAAALRALPPHRRGARAGRTKAPASASRWSTSWCGCTAAAVTRRQHARRRAPRFTVRDPGRHRAPARGSRVPSADASGGSRRWRRCSRSEAARWLPLPRVASIAATAEVPRGPRRRASWSWTTTPTCATTSRRLLHGHWTVRGGRRWRRRRWLRRQQPPDLVLDRRHDARPRRVRAAACAAGAIRDRRRCPSSCLGARRRGGAHRGAGVRRRRLPGQAVLSRASWWPASRPAGIARSRRERVELLDRERRRASRPSCRSSTCTRSSCRRPRRLPSCAGPSYVFELANDARLRAWGRRHREVIIGEPLLDVLPELRAQLFEPLLDEVYASGDTRDGTRDAVPVRPARTARSRTLYLNFVYSPLRDADGRR